MVCSAHRSNCRSTLPPRAVKARSGSPQECGACCTIHRQPGRTHIPRPLNIVAQVRIYPIPPRSRNTIALDTRHPQPDLHPRLRHSRWGVSYPRLTFPHRTPHTPTLDDYIDETKKMTNAKLVLWPEGALKFDTEAERNATFERDSTPGSSKVIRDSTLG
jgi:hypothetical protein